MNIVLLTSEKLVKQIACISDNVAAEYIHAAVTEAQEIKLKSILGPALLNKVKSLIEAGTIEAPENEYYNLLVEKVQYDLSYAAASELTYKTTYKITNFGVSEASDENLRVPSFEDVAKIKDYYQAKADYFCMEFQQFLYENRARFPELTQNHCSRIKANIYSAASCGIFLGGPRGKRG